MKVKLLVSQQSDPERIDEYFFEQNEISMGRESSNILTLPDPKKVVGRLHAKITRQSDTAHLVDMGSKNFTFLNNQRLEASRPYPLQNGDVIKIGGFSLQFFLIGGEIIDSDRTVFSEDFINPFANEAQELALLFSRISGKFAHEAENRRNEALEEALRDAFQNADIASVAGIIGNALGGTSAKPTDLVDQQPASTPAALTATTAPQIQHSPQPSPVQKTPQNFPFAEEFIEVFDIMLDYMLKLIKIPWQFRLEFIGQTIMQSSKVFSFHTSNPEEAKYYLLDSSISTEEREKRLQQFKIVSNEAILHQVALLDGYKTTVIDGTRRLLQSIDPKTITTELSQQAFKIGPLSIPVKFIPGYFQWKVMQLYKKRHRELIAEDQGIFEKKIFRPGFIKGYSVRMTSSHSSESFKPEAEHR